MESDERRTAPGTERRAIFRGGRRPYDRPGLHPPVLVAEGYEPARTPCASYLTLLHFEVAEAGLPTEAVALLDAGWQPHLILADPASAHAVSRRLAASTALVKPRLIVMTGALDEGRQQSEEMLLKPFRLSTMISAVRRALRHPQVPAGAAPRPFPPA